MTSTGAKWIKRRKILTPAFHFSILEEFIEVFDSQTTVLVENLKKFDSEVVDIFPFIASCALDVICGEKNYNLCFKKIKLIIFIETAMGIKLNSQSDPDCQYLKNVNEYKIEISCDSNF